MSEIGGQRAAGRSEDLKVRRCENEGLGD